MYLLDTNVVSEIRKVRRAFPAVIEWAKSVPREQMFLSVVTTMELEVGILLLARRDPVQANGFRLWLNDEVFPAFDGRIVPIDKEVALACAPLHVPNRKPDRDAFIAATALVRGFTVVTRNAADFAETGVVTFNPWKS